MDLAKESKSTQTIITFWLFCCVVMIYIMVVLGGVTRLTQSGLSITSWKPISGVIPPFSEQAWQHEFAFYRQTTQYKEQNFSMTLNEFKSIYWMEYTHRFVARITILLIILPFAYFVWQKLLDRKIVIGVSIAIGLGLTQGVIGWLMVLTGLSRAVSVSHYALTIHFAFAFAILTFIFWQYLNQFYRNHKNYFIVDTKVPVLVVAKYRERVYFVLSLIAIQIIFGALVAGLHAGLIYNTFPLMGGKLVPDDIIAVSGNGSLFSHPVFIQFCHRLIGIMVLVFSMHLYYTSIKNKITDFIPLAIHSFIFVVVMQFVLGVLTLINNVPIFFAAAHQFNSLLLFTNLLYIVYVCTHCFHVLKGEIPNYNSI